MSTILPVEYLCPHHTQLYAPIHRSDMSSRRLAGPCLRSGDHDWLQADPHQELLQLQVLVLADIVYHIV